jgi:RHS repeat-associated protein
LFPSALGSGLRSLSAGAKSSRIGRRIRKTTPSGTSIYAYDGDNLIEETDGNGAVVAGYTDGASIDEPLAMLRAGATSFYEADGLGSVTSLTNAAGALAQTYAYDSFGKLTASSGSIINPFRYTGREFDSTTGLYYYRARYYDPSTGSFVSEDPIRWFSGTADFGYVQNDPADLVDPLGLRASKSATADCIVNGLDALFPGVMASVGAAMREVGGHWNFPVQLQFPSYCAANEFYLAYKAAAPGWPPPARFGGGPAVHLENLGSWSVSGGTYTIAGTAHIDLYNPNDASQGGGGLGALAGHVGIDGVVGHLAQAVGSNIDPANCPWGKSCGQPQGSGPCNSSPIVH